MLQIILLVATAQLGRLNTEDVAVGGGTRSGSRLLKTEEEWKITADELKRDGRGTEADGGKKVKRWRRSARNGPPEG